MAQPIPCDMCGETEADFMVTNVHNGDTMGLGVECIGLFAQGVATAADLAAGEQAGDPDGPVVDPETDEPTDEPVDVSGDLEAAPVEGSDLEAAPADVQEG